MKKWKIFYLLFCLLWTCNIHAGIIDSIYYDFNGIISNHYYKENNYKAELVYFYNLKDGFVDVPYEDGYKYKSAPYTTSTRYEYVTGVARGALKKFEENYKRTGITIGLSYSSRYINEIPDSLYYGTNCIYAILTANHESMTRIGQSAFEDCNNLKYVSLSRINEIGKDAFKNCPKIQSVIHSKGLSAWCNIDFANEYSNPLYTHPKEFCPNFLGDLAGELIIPKDIVIMKDFTFYGYDTKKLVLHEDIVGYGNKTFANYNDNISQFTIISKRIHPIECNENIFSDKQYAKGALWVPKGSLESYQETYPWNKFRHIYELDDINIDPILNTKLSINSINQKLVIGNEAQITYSILPTSSTIKNVKWSSSNSNILQVNQDGKLFAKQIGDAVIKAESCDGSGCSDSVKITVIPVPVSSIKFIEDSVRIYHKQQIHLDVLIKPENAANKDVVWSTTDDNILSVDKNSGLITGVSVGTAQIMVSTTDGSNLTDTCEITVNPILVDSIKISSSTLSILDGSQAKLDHIVFPENASYPNISWTSDDSSIVSVDNTGLITAKKVGKTIIRATSTDGSMVSAICEISVMPALVEAIALNKNTLELYDGQSEQLTVSLLPQYISNRRVRWRSLDESLAAVDSIGVVRVKGEGTTKVIVSTLDGTDLSDSCVIVVKPILASQLLLSNNTISVENQSTYQLSYSFIPDNVTYKNIAWSSDDTTIVSVDDTGLVTAKKVGKTFVKATCTDGSMSSAKCEVVVTPALVKSISINKETLELYDGQSEQLTLKILPTYAANKCVNWKSLDESLAMIDSTGYVIVKGDGITKIIASTTDGSSLSDTCIVVVKPVLATSLTMNEETITIEDQCTYQLSCNIQPNNVTHKSLKWTSDDSTVAMVDDTGCVVARKVGTTAIHAATTDGTMLSATCDINVVPLLIKELSFSSDTIHLGKDVETSMTVTITPDNATSRLLERKSNNVDVATVDELGVVKTKRIGETKIIVTSVTNPSVKDECTIIVHGIETQVNTSLETNIIKLDWHAMYNKYDVVDYNVYVSENNKPFVLWTPNTTATSATFKTKDGVSYRFLVTARDNVGNMERYDETKCITIK